MFVNLHGEQIAVTKDGGTKFTVTLLLYSSSGVRSNSSVDFSN